MSVSLYSDIFAKGTPGHKLDIRFVGSISGCYSLPDSEETETDCARVFACRVQSISTKSAVLSGPMVGQDGDRVSAKFESFPVLPGVISRRFRDGFVMDFTVSEKKRYDIAAKIDWIKRHRFMAQKDRRTHKRIMPPHPLSAITLMDGRVLKCFVIDVSRSGVAVSAAIKPPVGERLAVGRAIGMVVRHLEAGFALRLDELLDLDDLDPIFKWSLPYCGDGEDTLPNLADTLNHASKK